MVSRTPFIKQGSDVQLYFVSYKTVGMNVCMSAKYKHHYKSYLFSVRYW